MFKRKARVIKVADDDEREGDAPAAQAADGAAPDADTSKPSFGSKAGRKPFRQSGLRKTFNNTDDASSKDPSSQADDDQDEGPAVVRPNVNRSGSSNQKKWKAKSSKLSFGQETAHDDDEDTAGGAKTVTKPTLGKRALENNAARRGIATRGLPVRSAQEEEDRPRYSREYLEELQSSTPNTPAVDVDAMDLDPSELEGALVVETTEPMQQDAAPTILTDAEIRERKERRSRMAKEQNFLSVEDDDEDDGRRKKKEETRLVAEDEELGEGFDDYVEDGGLSLGRRAEKERKKRDRQQMAELINAAEGHASDSSSDSDAERRIAYESAQSRAGLDGLKKPQKAPADDRPQVPAKITPLPALADCLARLQSTISSAQADMSVRRARVQQLRSERADIVKREAEVQALLDEAGKKYQEAMGGKAKTENGTTQSPAAATELAGERGLESLGATPLRAGQGDEVD